MFISMNWISDFVDLSGLDKNKLIAQFSLSTAEVENEIFYKGSDLSGVVAAKILSVEPHPESAKLHLLKVDCGESEPVDVVCGAPNVRVGMVTAFAKLGAKIGEITIAPRKLAGYTSCGMCCSEKEIGISDDNSGIMDITDDIPCGIDLKTVYDIDDIIFEVDNKSLTNRPDLWSHYGIAREFSTLAGRPLKPLSLADLSLYDSLQKVDMKIEDPLCQRYSCLQFENVNRHVSPVNVRIRLFYCGMRAINFLADLTNYLMLEMGQPMHAFDSRKVGKIRIRRFDAPFTFRTLDGVDRRCDENTLMICNDKEPVAIAGIMGGLDSEIVADTTTLTLESATFDAASVRKSTVRLSHRTDASMRYEKSLDPELTTNAIARFVYLLQTWDKDAKVVSALTDEYAFRYPERTLSFDKAFVDKYTGIDISSDRIESTLTALGFGVKRDGDSFEVRVPSWRGTKDVTMKADIIEEITRIYGYDNFDVHTAEAPLFPVRPFAEKTAEERIKDMLVKRELLHEVHSYVWAYFDEYKELGIEIEDNVKLANATNPNIETLRNSMVPTQLCQTRVNARYAPAFGIFEIGRVVKGLKEDGMCNEQKKLCITLFDRSGDTEALYRRLAEIAVRTLSDLRHCEVRFAPIEADHAYIHPKNYNDVLVNGARLGEIGCVHPTVGKKIDKKAAVVFMELDINAVTELADGHIRYEEPSKFPSIEIDLTFLCDRFAPIAEAIEAAKCAMLRKVSVIGTYADENGKSITSRLLFSLADRTLTREEVLAVTDKIVENLAQKGILLKK